MRDYPITTLDGGTDYDAIAGISFLLNQPAPLDRDGLAAYGTEFTLPDGRRFVYCYTALATILFGGAVVIDYTGGAASGQNARATLPATSAIPHSFGISTITKAAAGGLWVQTYGRCAYARVCSAAGGGTPVELGAPVKPINAAQYLIRDAAAIATVNAIAFYERSRNGAAGATAWTDTSGWQTVAVSPWVDIAFNIPLLSSVNTTHGDPSAQIFLTGIKGQVG